MWCKDKKKRNPNLKIELFNFTYSFIEEHEDVHDFFEKIWDLDPDAFIF